MYFGNDRHRKTWLNKCVKSRVPEESLTDNIAMLSKDCWNLNESAFTISINHCRSSYVGKSHF